MNLYTDRCFKKFGRLEYALREENERQLEKWGIREHTAFEWLGYTTEELGELAKAISEHEYRVGKSSDVFKEAIQVATLALKIAEMYMK